MTGSRLVGGVDAGASHTAAVVADETLRVLGRAVGSPGAVRPGGEDAAAAAIMATVVEALRRTGAGEESLAALVVGAAGTGADTAQVALASALRTRGSPSRTVVCTDAEAALASAFPEGEGILLVAGTGSIALARDATGTSHRVGGRGWRVGDEGSGYALGRAGVSAAVRALEGRGPPTGLADDIPAVLGLAAATDLFAWAAEAEPRAVAALGTVVQAASEAGDAVALGVVDSAAEDLVAHVVALRPPFDGKPAVPVALAGGALGRESPLRQRVIALLGARARWAIVQEVDVDAALGAARLARRLLVQRSLPTGSA